MAPARQTVVSIISQFPLMVQRIFLVPATKLGQGNIFGSMCKEFCSQWGGGKFPGPHPRGKLKGLVGGSPGPHLGGYPSLRWGGWSPGPGPGGCIPACTEADTPQQTGTAAGGTHPTGMHSCVTLNIVKVTLSKSERKF